MREFTVRTTDCCTPHTVGLRGSYIGGNIVTALLDLTGDRAWDQMSHYKGIRSDITRAARRGYRFREFAGQSRIKDIVAINTSSPARQGRPMSSPYLRTEAELGGEDPAARVTIPPCRWHWRRTVGVFDAEDTLVSYISLVRTDNLALYSMILGHADHLHSGIMHQMHEGAVRLLQRAGVEAVMYAGWGDGGLGLQNWKRRLGFEPVRLVEP